MQLLSEDHALELIDKWCTPDVPLDQELPFNPNVCDLAVEPPAMHHGELTHTVVTVYDISYHPSLETALVVAIELRRAMETLNALACCRGLDPQQNPAFWRKVFHKFWQPECVRNPPKSLVLHRLPRDLFRRFHVICMFSSLTERVAAAIAHCIATKPTSPAMQARAMVLDTLRDYLACTPPAVEISIRPHRDEFSWLGFKRILQRLDCMLNPVYLPPRDSCHERVDVVMLEDDSLTLFDSDKERPTLAYMFDVLAVPCVHLTELKLHVGWATHFEYDVEPLMRQLVARDTLRTLSWRFTACEKGAISSICSALPRMARLESFSLVFDDLAACATNPIGQTYRCWLAYALDARKRSGFPLAVELQALESMEKATDPCVTLQRLAEGFPKSFKEKHAPVTVSQWMTAELAEATPLAKLNDDYGSVLVYRSERVDVVAQYNGHAIVVAPGVGLMTAPRDALRDWRVDESKSPHVFETVVLRESSAADVLQMLPLFGPQLTSLSLVKCARIEDAALRKMLEMCPRLTKLAILDGSVASFRPLLDAYARGECRISTLIYQSHRTKSSRAAEIFQALASGENPSIAATLRELCVEEIPLTRHQLNVAAQAIAQNKSLEYVRVCVKPKLVDERWMGFVDQPLGLNPRSKCALYTFLLAARRHRVLRMLPLPCMELVARFGAVPVLRYVS